MRRYRGMVSNDTLKEILSSNPRKKIDIPLKSYKDELLRMSPREFLRRVKRISIEKPL